MGNTRLPSDLAFPADFVDFVHALNRHGVEYVLVGGYAVAVHGYVRATIDIDFFYRCAAENVGRLINALEEFGAPPEVIAADDLANPEIISAFGQPPLRIDLLPCISGVTFDEALSGAVHARVGSEVVRVIGLAALRLNKAASDRPKDRADLKALSG